MSYYHIVYAIFLSILALTCIVVTSQRSKYKHTPLILAPVILWLGLLAEGAGFLYGTYVTFDNGWIYNTANIIFFALFYFMMYRYIQKPALKRAASILSTIGILFYCFRFFIAETINVRLSTAHCIAVLILLVLSVIYIVQLLRSNESIHLRQHPEFLFIGGNLVLNLVYAPIYVSSDLNLHIFSESFYTYVSSIHGYVCMAMSLLFIFSFLWTKKAHIQMSQVSEY